MNFSSLPPELIREILQHLGKHELCTIALVNKSLCHISKEDRYWKPFFTVFSGFSPKEVANGGWKDICKQEELVRKPELALKVVKESSKDQSFEGIENTLTKGVGYWCSRHTKSMETDEFLEYKFAFPSVVTSAEILCHRHGGQIYNAGKIQFEFGNKEYVSPIYPIQKTTASQIFRFPHLALPQNSHVIVRLIGKTEQETPGNWCVSMDYVGFAGTSFETEELKNAFLEGKKKVERSSRFGLFFRALLGQNDDDEEEEDDMDDEEEDEIEEEVEMDEEEEMSDN